MNTPTAYRRILPALTVFGLLSPWPAAAKEKPVADASGEAKPFVLFVGVDLAVQRDKKYHRVADVVGSEFKIRIGKKEFFVPTRQRQTALKVDYGLKIAYAAVQLDGLEAGPGYTPANDPKLKFARESGAAGGAAAVQDLAYGTMISASLGASLSSAAAGGGGPGAAGAQAAADAAQLRLSDAQRQLDVASQMATQDRYNTGLQAHRMMNELDEANYDAMEVSFKISSPVELDDPYMVVLFKFLEREALPGEESMLIHAKSLDPIGPDPKYIRVREGGIPKGFKYVDCEVHIYNRGQEIASNVSPKRVELTRAEAQEYLVIEHLGTNKGATAPAGAVPGTLPLERRKQLSLDQLNRTFYAKVAPDGSLLGVFLDQGCQQRLEDAAPLAAIGEVFFKPALDQGKPREGVARFTLGGI